MREPTQPETRSPLPPFPPGPTRAITGTFTEPRPRARYYELDLSPPPASAFPPLEPFDVMLWDVVEGVAHAFGLGSSAQFTRDGRYLVWTAYAPDFAGSAIAIGTATLLDLATLERRDLGPARSFGEQSEGVFVATIAGNAREFVDLATGARTPAPPAPTSNALPRYQQAGHFRLVERVRAESDYRNPDWWWSRTYRLVDLTGGLDPLEFTAFQAALSDDGSLFISTTPNRVNVVPSTEERRGGETFGTPRINWGWSNVFQVDAETGAATFVASRVGGLNAPFSAGGGYVGWGDDWCASLDFKEARLVVLERATGGYFAFRSMDWFTLTPQGQLALGAFGPKAMLSLATLEYIWVMPRFAKQGNSASDTVVSPDGRFVARAFAGGHGGYCYA